MHIPLSQIKKKHRVKFKNTVRKILWKYFLSSRQLKWITKKKTKKKNRKSISVNRKYMIDSSTTNFVTKKKRATRRCRWQVLEGKVHARLYFTSAAIIMTFKRRATDCTATGVSFPNRMIYLARRWAGGITKNYEGVMNLIKCACTLPSNSRNALPEPSPRHEKLPFNVKRRGGTSQNPYVFNNTLYNIQILPRQSFC